MTDDKKLTDEQVKNVNGGYGIHFVSAEQGAVGKFNILGPFENDGKEKTQSNLTGWADTDESDGIAPIY